MTTGEKITHLLAEQLSLGTQREHWTTEIGRQDTARAEEILVQYGVPVLLDALDEVCKTNVGPTDSPRVLVQALMQGGANLNRLIEAYGAVREALDFRTVKILKTARESILD